MSNANLAFLHTSPAAIAPLARFYARHEPAWVITNLMDDGILRLFQQSDEGAVETALSSLLRRAVENYGARAAMITCSSVNLRLLGRLERQSPIPLLKIDVPMARAAVEQAERIGVLISFRPTTQPTVTLLRETAEAAGRRVEIVPHLCPGAYDALLTGDTATHDRLLREGAESLVSQGLQTIVLAQVSMSHLREPLEAALGVPVVSSLETSHAALRKLLG